MSFKFVLVPTLTPGEGEPYEIVAQVRPEMVRDGGGDMARDPLHRVPVLFGVANNDNGTTVP